MKTKILFITFVTLALFSACKNEQKNTIPDELVGVWKTKAPKYAGSFFELTKDKIIIGTVEGNVISGMIDNVEKKEAGSEGNIIYTINYGNSEEEDFLFSFIYDPADNGTIRFRNQDQIVWIKEVR